jgi:hypothetical protein
VVNLVRAKFSDGDIIGHIVSMRSNFDLSADGVKELNRCGVSAAVIEAMRSRAAPATPVAAAPVAPRIPVPLKNDLPFAIVLMEDVPAEPAPGIRLRFRSTVDVRSQGYVVIAKDAAVTGEVLEPHKKGILGRGGKPIFRLIDVVAVDGRKLKVKATPGRKHKNERNIEPPGHQGKDSLAPAGTPFQAFIDGDQAVTVKQ